MLLLTTEILLFDPMFFDIAITVDDMYFCPQTHHTLCFLITIDFRRYQVSASQDSGE